MWSQKAALTELQGRLLTSSLGATSSRAVGAMVKHYRRKAAANRRRLSKSQDFQARAAMRWALRS